MLCGGAAFLDEEKNIPAIQIDRYLVAVKRPVKYGIVIMMDAKSASGISLKKPPLVPRMRVTLNKRQSQPGANMFNKIYKLLGAILLASIPVKAVVLNLPYVSGKQENSFQINFIHTNIIQNKYGGEIYTSTSPDTVNIGNLFSVSTIIQNYMATPTYISSMQDIALKFTTNGSVNKTSSMDTNWSIYLNYPDTLINLDSFPNVNDTGKTGPGYSVCNPYKIAGGDWSWYGLSEGFYLAQNYNQVVFFRNGKIFGKLKLTEYHYTTHQDTGYVQYPDSTQHAFAYSQNILSSITVKYLINDTNNLSENSVSTRTNTVFKSKLNSKYYNILGIPFDNKTIKASTTFLPIIQAK